MDVAQKNNISADFAGICAVSCDAVSGRVSGSGDRRDRKRDHSLCDSLRNGVDPAAFEQADRARAGKGGAERKKSDAAHRVDPVLSAEKAFGLRAVGLWCIAACAGGGADGGGNDCHGRGDDLFPAPDCGADSGIFSAGKKICEKAVSLRAGFE
ncbi:MAG: hypothetical protein ACLTQL_13705 [Eisenbergiella sp.]